MRASHIEFPGQVPCKTFKERLRSGLLVIDGLVWTVRIETERVKITTTKGDQTLVANVPNT